MASFVALWRCRQLVSRVLCRPSSCVWAPWRGPCRLKLTMMPVSLLIALLLAFGIEPVQADVPQSDVIARVLETCGGVTLVATLAFGLGAWVSFQASHSDYSPS